MIRLVTIRKALMIKAAVASSLRVLRMRPTGLASGSFGSPLTSGMTATPVSKPESPSASFGKIRMAKPTSSKGLLLRVVSACDQFEKTSGCAMISRMPRTPTITFNPR